MRNPFKKGTIKEGCVFNPDGSVKCESRRITEDGEEILGEVNFSLNQNCDVVPNGELWESENGVIDRLNKKFISQVKGKCRSKPTGMSSNRPEDY